MKAQYKKTLHTTTQQLRHTLVLLACCLGITACGGQDSQQLPGTASLSVSPSQLSWDIDVSPDGCTFDPSFYNDHSFRVSLADGGAAIGDIDVDILANLTAATFTGAEVIQLYEDTNGNGAIDNGIDRLVSQLGGGAYRMRLNDQGYNTLLVRVNLSCPYRADIQFFAGAATNSINIEVTANTTAAEE